MNVGDYMNQHLVYLREGDRVDLARRPMADLGLTAVPVLDEEHKPVGVVSLRDLVDARDGTATSEPLRTVLASASIEEAARVLVAEDLHHLVVVDATGAAVGMLSSLDVVRALVRSPPKHPAAIDRLVASVSEDFESEYRSE